MYRLLTLLFILSISLSDTRTVAISYFDNTSGTEEYNPLSKGLADMLITDLSNVRSLRIVEREKLESLLKEIELGDGKFIDPNTAQKLGKGLGAGYMLTGSFLIMGETMRIDARLVDVGTGEITMAEEITGEKNTFFELEKVLKNKLVESLNIELSKTESRRIKKSQTESFEAFSAYSSSLDAFDKEEFEKSAEFLEMATESDEDFNLAWEKLEEIEKKIADIIAARAAGFASHIIKKIDDLDGLNDSDCNQFFSMFLELWRNHGAIWGQYSHWEPDVKNPTPEKRLSTWQSWGITSVPNTRDQYINVLGKYIGRMIQMIDYLENKKYPDTFCGYVNPNAYAYYIMCEVLATYYMVGVPQPSFNAIDHEGNILLSSDDFSKAVIKYGTKFMSRFPRSEFFQLVDTRVQFVIEIEKQKN